MLAGTCVDAAGALSDGQLDARPLVSACCTAPHRTVSYATAA